MSSEDQREPQASRRAVAAVELASFFRPELEDLQPYVPHDPPGIKVKLDANEAPPSTSAAVKHAALRAIEKVTLERYPDPRALRLKEAIAKRTGAPVESLVVGTGSDELISLAMTALAAPREGAPQPVVLTPIPTFVMYRVTARGHGWKPIQVALDRDWDIDVAMTKRAIEMMRPNVVWIASPNNPTGNRMTEARLRAVVEASSALTVIDEAYIDYARGPSLRSWREGRPHVGILRTVSKIGLAALRVGWLECDPEVARAIDKVRQPFNVSATSQAAVAAVLEEAWDEVQFDVRRVAKARDELSDAITALGGYTVTPSDANFLWVKTPGPAEPIYDALVKSGILVRSFHGSGGRLASQLRITIGTDTENAALLMALARAARGARK